MFWCFHVVMTISSGSREPARFKPPGYKLTDMGMLKKKKKHASTLPAHAQTHSYIPHVYTHAASLLPAVLFSPLICWVSWSPLRLLAFPLLDIREQGRRCRGGEYDGRERGSVQRRKDTVWGQFTELCCCTSKKSLGWQGEEREGNDLTPGSLGAEKPFFDILNLSS